MPQSLQSWSLASGCHGRPRSAKPQTGGPSCWQCWGWKIAGSFAKEVQASFQLPQQMQELGMKEADLQAPPALPCLCQQRFMLPAQSIDACRDIREIPQEKVVAYARALQHWAEEINLPAGGGPHLLAEGMKELREEVKLYLSFSNEEVFQGVALPKKEDQSPKTLSADVPKASCVPESAMKRRSPKFLGWEKFCIHPRPVVAAGEISQPFKALRPRGGPIQLPQTVLVKPPASPSKTPTPPKPSSPVQALAVVQPTTLPHGFAGVTACLQTPELLELASEVPLGTMSIGVVVTPRISTMSTSHIIQDEATGVPYMDTVTTSIGRVALSGPDSETSSPALQSKMSPATNRQLADNCHWADNQLLPTTEQTNIPSYCY